MSAPQHIGVRAHRQVGYLAFGSRPVAPPPRKLSLGSRQVGCLAFGSRPVGSPAYRRWGADRSVPQKIAVGGPTCRLPRHCRNNLGQSSWTLPKIMHIDAKLWLLELTFKSRLKEYSSLQDNPYNVRFIHTVLIVHNYFAPRGVDNVLISESSYCTAVH